MVRENIPLALISTVQAPFSLVQMVWFYGLSTIVGYLMPNPLYTYIHMKYMICKHIL